jgi:hypothetical protein
MLRNLWWVVAGAGILGLGFVSGSPFPVYAAYTFLLLVVLANVTSRAWLSGLDCERTVSVETLQQGETTEVEVRVTNRHGWPIPWIFIEDATPAHMTVEGEPSRLAVLMPGRSVRLKYRLRCPRRGYHAIGPLLMESGDLFGLQKRFRTGTARHYVSVLPTVAYIDTFTISARRPQGPVRVSNRVYEDPTRIAGLREYAPGDPLNKIHWKATARTGEIYVKQSEPANVLGATVVLDLFAPWYQGDDAEMRVELAVTTAASLAWLLQMSGEQLGMLTNARDAAEDARYAVASAGALARDDIAPGGGDDPLSGRISPLEVPTMRSPVQARRIIENLARVVPGDGLDAGTLLMTSHRRFPRDAALIVVTPKVTDDFALVLATLKETGYAVTVFLVANNKNFPEAGSLLAPHHIHVLHITHERDLHEINPARIGR